ncbi:GNAT family N-acetyltransferase [Erwinia sp. V90_4]|uniref:GNAT family N-acetyltransferase n=1 Tax=Erwinia sp. V90_4 TaxID=3044239 RepID=UPI00249E5723|nr:GNAT family N-acetyltransferase [Erwinia sp. V90_4]MDI3439057.1 GNAT family N-acetyltransferase [Erwinia sp. V90_4]
MSLTLLTQLADIPASQWDALTPNAQPFMRHAFLSALEESGSVNRATGWQPQHLLWCEGDKVLAAMPGYAKTHSMGEYVFDHAWAEASQRARIPYYPKWLSAVPFSPVSGARLLGNEHAGARLLQALPQFLEQQALYSAHINFSDARVHQHLAGDERWLPRLGCQYHWHNRGFRDFQDFLDLLTSRKRKQLRKERELVASQGVEFAWYEGAQLSEAQWDFIYDCYANTYLVRGRQPYLTRLFFSLLAQSMPAAIRVIIASQHGDPVAMAFSLVDGDTLYGRYWGCLEEFNRLHFETCFWQGMEYAIAHGLQRFDAGAQGEHKLIRGFEPVLTESWHRLRHPGLHDAVADFLQQERDGVRAWAEEARSALPWRQSPA